jgi:hypothetical protein
MPAMAEAYNDAFRQKLVAIKDGIFIKLQASGLQFREYAVKLAFVNEAAVDPLKGNAAAASSQSNAVYKTLVPRPKVDLRDQFKTIDEAPIKVGDGILSISRGACSREELESAAWLMVGDIKYTIVMAGTRTVGVPYGGVKETPTYYEVILTREHQ